MYVVVFLALFGICYASDVPTEDQTKLAASAVTEFSLDLLKQVLEEGKNAFFSGYSIAVALGMVSLGARENTLTEIDKTFHFDKVNANDPKGIHKVFKACIDTYNKPNNNYTLSTANRLYGQDNFKIEQLFQNDIKHYYSGELQQLDFTIGTAEGIINDWVSKQTNDKIKNLFPPGSLDSNTVLVLVNAIYFKGNWNKQFRKELTTTEKFHTSKTTDVQVKMMQQTSHFNYHYDSSLKVKVLELPYVGKDLSMFILLPDEIDGLSALVNSLTATKLQSLMNSVDDANVQVKLPKFKLETEYSLVDVLAKLGIHDLFNEKADLNAMGSPEPSVTNITHKAFVDVDETGTEAAAATGVGVGINAIEQWCNVSGIMSDEWSNDVAVTDVVHKAFIQVDEEGTEAAAATGIKFGVRSGLVRVPFEFTVNHPSLFVIRDVPHKINLFTGVLSDVSSSA